jgi:hypothetical protein
VQMEKSASFSNWRCKFLESHLTWLYRHGFFSRTFNFRENFQYFCYFWRNWTKRKISRKWIFLSTLHVTLFDKAEK